MCIRDRLYARYKELADKETGGIFGGRLGEYKYYDMDTTIASVPVSYTHLLSVRNSSGMTQ